ncbi:hypothetical protein PCANC_13350 [Puccinia coronata f. sp. avenae]|uniref:Uncharacterized protein n=2 Tax=Puccinia coronata f. sp. avenae TaxID=200324 RepID=A0A2N5STX4_9BASI|nr:hypothetical protein PCANC_13350 [Puccinia coronata f. sp. avenae]PLW23839.1 hypothetical protein PCASD_10629 [Puccinia coronata f. sp. avenae]
MFGMVNCSNPHIVAHAGSNAKQASASCCRLIILILLASIVSAHFGADFTVFHKGGCAYLELANPDPLRTVIRPGGRCDELGCNNQILGKYYHYDCPYCGNTSAEIESDETSCGSSDCAKYG